MEIYKCEIGNSLRHLDKSDKYILTQSFVFHPLVKYTGELEWIIHEIQSVRYGKVGEHD